MRNRERLKDAIERLAVTEVRTLLKSTTEAEFGPIDSDGFKKFYDELLNEVARPLMEKFRENMEGIIKKRLRGMEIVMKNLNAMDRIMGQIVEDQHLKSLCHKIRLSDHEGVIKKLRECITYFSEDDVLDAYHLAHQCLIEVDRPYRHHKGEFPYLLYLDVPGETLEMGKVLVKVVDDKETKEVGLRATLLTPDKQKFICVITPEMLPDTDLNDILHAHPLSVERLAPLFPAIVKKVFEEDGKERKSSAQEGKASLN